MITDRKVLGKTGIAVSPVGFGVLPMGPWQLRLPVEDGAAVLRFALEKGFNFLDTAQYYKTYPYIRTALSGTSLEPVISSKSLAASYDEMAAAVEECRRELDRDVIDIFLLHEVRSPEDYADRAPALAALMDEKAKGHIKAVGLSTHHVDVAEMTAEKDEMELLFPLINFAGLGIRKGSGNGSAEDMAAAIKKAALAGKGVFTMKAFGGGNLVPHYKEALDYVFSLEGVSSTMVGFTKQYEVQQMLDYLDGKLPGDFSPALAHKSVHVDKGDCRGCGNCVRRCPNGAMHYGQDGLAEVDKTKCLTCGYCAPVCPVLAILLY